MPPNSVLTEPTQDISLVFTTYFFDTFLFSLTRMSSIATVTNADLSPTFPVLLDTSDLLLLALAPGLILFPNTNLSLSITANEWEPVTISEEGIALSLTLGLGFDLIDNDGVPLTPAFAIDAQIDATVYAVAGMSNAVNASVGFNFTNVNSNITTLYSQIGIIDSSAFTDIINLLLPVFSSYQFDVTPPSVTVLSNPNTSYGDGYVSVGYDMGLLLNVTVIECPDSSFCPDGYSCCPYVSGGYYCCAFAGAVCCSDGTACCPAGTTCDTSKGECKAKRRYLKENDNNPLSMFKPKTRPNYARRFPHYGKENHFIALQHAIKQHRRNSDQRTLSELENVAKDSILKSFNMNMNQGLRKKKSFNNKKSLKNKYKRMKLN